jgi:hypothetical protein
MDPQIARSPGEEVPAAPPPPVEQVELEQLLAGTQALLEETSSQLRDVGELAFLEFELAISCFKWSLVAVIVLAAAGALGCTFLLAGLVFALTGLGFTPMTAMFVCAGVAALLVVILVLWLRSLAKKMSFGKLRDHLTRSPEQPRV